MLRGALWRSFDGHLSMLGAHPEGNSSGSKVHPLDIALRLVNFSWVCRLNTKPRMY